MVDELVQANVPPTVLVIAVPELFLTAIREKAFCTAAWFILSENLKIILLSRLTPSPSLVGE